MARKIDFSTAQWIRSCGSPDLNGPTDVSFTPYDKDWFDRPLIDVIGDVASRHPVKIAIDDGVIRLTYSQLYAMACRLSHAICRAELPPGAIGIKLSYGALHPVAILGCLAAGRPCLLMSKDHPPDYNRRLIEASGLQALLVNAAEAQNGPAQGGPHLIIIEPGLMIGGDFDEQPADRLGPDEPAFIISTSGSTGVPKLIVSSQRRLHTGISMHIGAGHLNKDDRFLNLGSSASIAVIMYNLLPLLIGGQLHILDISRTGISNSLRVLRDHKITILRTTVSLMKAISQLDEASAHLSSLREVLVFGEMLLQKDLEQIRAILPQGCRFAYLIGSTETLTFARWFVPENDGHDPVRVAVGYLDPEAEVFLLDDDGRPCPMGEIGDLIVRSPNVALGEWIGGHVVADRFPRDPKDPTKRIYRTGDLARICPDGVLVMHGRKDRMIKIRGQRVEPAVIETTIRNISGVADAAVAARQSDGDVRIYGFVVPSAQAGDDLLTDVNNSLKTALPSYMRPSEIVIVKSLPNNAGGKVDVKALLALVPSEGGAASSTIAGPAPLVSHEPASDRVRDMVANAWRAAFRTVPRDSPLSFEAAGGDSLKFIQIIFRLEQLSGASLPLGAFDMSMTQHDMSRRLDFHLGGGVESRRSGKQVFLLPGIGGDEPRLVQFRIGCAPELSIVCLDYGDWTQWIEPGFDYDTIVDRLVAQIRGSAPTGPLSLAGYSFGGWTALAVAARLNAAGREIEHLLILDTRASMPQGGENTTAAELDVGLPTLRQEFWRWWRAYLRGDGIFAVAAFAARRLVRPRWAPLLRWIARHRRMVLPGQIDFYLNFCIHEQYLKLLSNRRCSLPEIPRLPVAITLFIARDYGNPADREAGWDEYSPNVTVVSIGGNHFTMFDPPHLADFCGCFKDVFVVGTDRQIDVSR